jgi:cytochrome c-type biogenesis protein CcmH
MAIDLQVRDRSANDGKELVIHSRARDEKTSTERTNMIALILTGLAGIAIGIVAMRLLQANSAPTAIQPTDGAKPVSLGAASGITADVSGPVGAGGLLSKYSRTQLLLGSAGGIMAIAIAVLAFRGDGQDATAVASTPLASAAAPAGSLDDVDTMIAKLAERLKTDVTDGEGFRMLGWSYVNTNRPAEAVTAYATAVKLLPGRADVHAGYGEAMVAVAKDVVTPEAKMQFDEAVKIDAKEPRARFFLALHKAQNGQERAALDEWIALSNASSADLPWQSDLQARATKLAAKLGVDITGKFKRVATAPSTPKDAGPFMASGPDAATVAAATKLPAADQRSMVDGMVEGLAAKLQANPDNVDGWIKLIRSRVVLKDKAKAKDDLGMARQAFASKPDKLAQINSVAAELGL